jgi:hypothetical protein
MPQRKEHIVLDGQQVPVSNLDKVLFPNQNHNPVRAIPMKVDSQSLEPVAQHVFLACVLNCSNPLVRTGIETRAGWRRAGNERFEK